MKEKNLIEIRLNKRFKSEQNRVVNSNNYLFQKNNKNNNENDNSNESDTKPSPVHHKTHLPVRSDNLFLFQSHYKSKKPSIIDSSVNSMNTSINRNQNNNPESPNLLYPSIYINNNEFSDSNFIHSLNPSNESLLNDKILKIKENILRRERKYTLFCEDKKLKAKMKQNEIKRKNEKRKIKVKLYKILVNESQICQDFEKKNEVFNLKVMNYLNSKTFINNQKLLNNNLHFSKNELNRTNNPYMHLFKMSQLQQNLITPKDILNNLNESERKLFLDEPKFYIKGNSHLLNMINSSSSKTLTQKLQEEEIIEKIKKHSKNKSDVISYKKKFDEKYFNTTDDKKTEGNIENLEVTHKKMINTILKTDLEQKWINYEKDKKLNLFIKNAIKNCELKIQDGKIRDSFEENRNFHKSFDKNIYYYHKQSMIDRNFKRLCKEKDFHKKKNNIPSHKNSSDKIINDFTSRIQQINKAKSQK